MPRAILATVDGCNGTIIADESLSLTVSPRMMVCAFAANVVVINNIAAARKRRISA
jgi:hypothetical protein